MVKGRQKRGYRKNMARVGATTLSKEDLEANSPAKKETKKDETHGSAVGAHFVRQTCKSPVNITSFFRAQVTGGSIGNVAKDENFHTRCFFTDRQVPVDAQKDIVSDVEHFRTDETPVAVPIHSPPTPHRINMPNNETENLHGKEKQVVSTLSPVQSVAKKSIPRGRRKGNHNLTVNRRLTDSASNENANHKLTDFFPVRRSIRKCKKAVLEERQRDMENKVLCQVEEGLEVRYFPGKGRGVVTTREFGKGEFVVEYIGELIDQVTAKKREKIYAQDQNTGCYMYYFQHRNQQYCVDATKETDKLGRLVNHSRNGNLVARVVEVESVPHLVLTAKEDIPVGVEIAYDYGDRSREAIRHHPWLAL